jgi:hypothetical protein
LTLNGASVEQHFVSLANKYPVIVFERQMTHYIARSQKLLADPKLSRNAEDIGLLIPPTTSAYADGSLSMPVSDDDDDETMEEIDRLEEIKEEEEENEVRPTVVHSPPTHQQQAPPQKHSRHEKMKLATITLSMDDGLPGHGHHPHEQHAFGGHNVSAAHGYHLPSPPPSVAVSRSSTVSPSNSSSSSTGSLSEEEESIAEAARILMSSNVKNGNMDHNHSNSNTIDSSSNYYGNTGVHTTSKKHKYVDESSLSHHPHQQQQLHTGADDRIHKAAIRPIKKMKV